jgi:hypothetical protein
MLCGRGEGGGGYGRADASVLTVTGREEIGPEEGSKDMSLVVCVVTVCSIEDRRCENNNNQEACSYFSFFVLVKKTSRAKGWWSPWGERCAEAEASVKHWQRVDPLQVSACTAT